MIECPLQYGFSQGLGAFTPPAAQGSAQAPIAMPVQTTQDFQLQLPICPGPELSTFISGGSEAGLAQTPGDTF